MCLSLEVKPVPRIIAVGRSKHCRLEAEYPCNLLIIMALEPPCAYAPHGPPCAQVRKVGLPGERALSDNEEAMRVGI